MTTEGTRNRRVIRSVEIATQIEAGSTLPCFDNPPALVVVNDVNDGQAVAPSGIKFLQRKSKRAVSRNVEDGGVRMEEL